MPKENTSPKEQLYEAKDKTNDNKEGGGGHMAVSMGIILDTGEKTSKKILESLENKDKIENVLKKCSDIIKNFKFESDK